MTSLCNQLGLALAILLLPAGAVAQQPGHTSTTQNTTTMHTITEQNKSLIRRLYDEALNKKNMSLLDEFISPGYVGAGGLKGAAGFEANVAALIRAFPGIQWHIEEMIAEGDKVVIRWKWQGTQQAPFNGFAAIGKSVSNEATAIYTVSDAKVSAVHMQTDRLGFLQQLEVIPLNLSQLAKTVPKGAAFFIDKFFVPAAAKAEFLERMEASKTFLKTLPGFVKDESFQQGDADGNLTVITVATWQDEAAIAKAKDAVQAEYRRTGFNPKEFFERAHITLERGMYKEIDK